MKGRSSLFLIEQLIVIAVFAICAAVCVKIISTAYAMTNDAVDARRALIVAENAAESFKAFEGDAHGVIEFLNGAQRGDNMLFIRYDENWQPLSEGNASFILWMLVNDDENSRVIFADIYVTRLIDNEELVRLTTAVRRAQ